MPGKLRRNEYDLVEEAYDSKSPVHNEDAFEHGIAFRVKVTPSSETQGLLVCLKGRRALLPFK